MVMKDKDGLIEYGIGFFDKETGGDEIYGFKAVDMEELKRTVCRQIEERFAVIPTTDVHEFLNSVILKGVPLGIQAEIHATMLTRMNPEKMNEVRERLERAKALAHADLQPQTPQGGSQGQGGGGGSV